MSSTGSASIAPASAGAMLPAGSVRSATMAASTSIAPASARVTATPLPPNRVSIQRTQSCTAATSAAKPNAGSRENGLPSGAAPAGAVAARRASTHAAANATTAAGAMMRANAGKANGTSKPTSSVTRANITALATAIPAANRGRACGSGCNRCASAAVTAVLL